METMRDTHAPARSLTPYPPLSADELKEGSDRDATDEDEQPASEPELEDAKPAHIGNKHSKQARAPVHSDAGEDGDDDEAYKPTGAAAAAAPVKPKPKRVPRQLTPPLETKGAAYEAAIAILRKWLSEHLDDPYPDADQKQKMSEETGLTYGQVQHWFINARMRYLRPMLAARQAELEAPKKPDSDLQSVVPLSLSALSSVATYAAPLETAVAHADAEQLASEAAGQVDQTVPAAAAAASSSAASSSPVVPRSTLFDLSRTLLSLSEFAPISDAEGAEARLPRPSVTKHKPKPQHALSAAIFANGQTKAGRVVKRKSTSLEEDGPDAAESSDAAAAAAPAVGIPLSSSDGDDDDDDRNKKRKGPRGVGTRVFDPKQRRSKLPLKAVGALRTYFLAHIDHPFPKDTDKTRLGEEVGLAFKQVSDWFTNTRKRFWRPYADYLEREGCGLAAKGGNQVCTCGAASAAPAAAAAAAGASEVASASAPAVPPLHSWLNMWN